MFITTRRDPFFGSIEQLFGDALGLLPRAKFNITHPVRADPAKINKGKLSIRPPFLGALFYLLFERSLTDRFGKVNCPVSKSAAIVESSNSR